MLSVVIPTLNAAASLPGTLASVGRGGRGCGRRRRQQRRNAGAGGDARGACAGGAARAGSATGRGRGGWHMANGCCCCTPIPGCPAGGTAARTAGPATRAGYFRFALDSDDPRARRLERLVAWRCRVLALPYGDQGLLIHRDLLSGGRRHPAAAADGRRRPGPPPRPPAAGGAGGSRSHLRREVAARGLVSPLAAQSACLTLYFAGVPPRLIARLYR